MSCDPATGSRESMCIMILVPSLPVCPRCLWPRARVSSRLWSYSPGNWRCLGQRSKEHFVWTVRPTTLLPLPLAAKAGKLMYVMHNSEHPLSCFALFENGPCLIADTNFDVLMVKLKGFFQSAKASKIETRGTRYQYCDFLVKVGTVTMGPSARGISVEVRPR
uniref:Mediator of RNA polymerase II transcription subunit 20 n=1 Tax=Sus scrofa TaxID=9823 RepID=A0A8D1H5S1_PIG